MKKIILLGIAFFIVGCCDDSSSMKSLSTAQIAQKVQECRDYNLSIQWAYRSDTGEIHTISCIPSKEK